MRTGVIIFDYFYWHYTAALGSLLGLYKNLFLFVTHFFSLPLLVRTWIAPWRRLDEKYPSSLFDFEQFGSTLIVNVLMRIVGFVVRSILIALALLVLALLALSFPLVLVLWLLLPAGVVIIFLIGIGLLFR